MDGGACMVGGHTWLGGTWFEGGGMCGWRGVCVVGGHAWLEGACVVGGACLVGGGHAWLDWGAWLEGGMHGWGACVVGGVHGWRGHAWLRGMHRIQLDTVNEQAVLILLECILVPFICVFLLLNYTDGFVSCKCIITIGLLRMLTLCLL